MKLIEAAAKAFSVIRKSDSKKLFSDSRSECIAFIKGFDKGSKKYVDLRLLDPNGKEDDWHTVKEGAEYVKQFSKEEQKFVDLIKANCPNNFKALVSGKAVPLFRGTNITNGKIIETKAGHEFAFMKKRTVPRISLTGDNLLNSYVSQTWKNVPPRNLSSSCTPKFGDAADFDGPTWLIIPSDNVKLYGMIPRDFNLDYASSFAQGGPRLLDHMANVIKLRRKALEAQQLARQIKTDHPVRKKFLEVLDGPVLDYAPEKHFLVKDIQELSDHAEKIIDFVSNNRDEILSKVGMNLMPFIDYLDVFEAAFEGPSLMEWLEERLSADNMSVKTAKSYPSVNKKYGEVWFEGDYVCVLANSGSLDMTDELPKSEFFQQVVSKI